MKNRDRCIGYGLRRTDKKHVLYLVSCILCLMLSTSCKKKVLIPEKDFVSILADMYLSKSYFSAKGVYNARWNDTIPYNRHIVEQHGYAWARFDSTVSWYCSRPKRYQEVYEEVMTQLNELDRVVSAELDPPSELWHGRREKYLPADGRRDSVHASVLLKGVGSYVISAKIRVYPEDKSLNPHIALYLWRSDTTARGVYDTLWMRPLRKDGLLTEYTFEKTLEPGNAFTHIKGNWLQCDTVNADTAWTKRAEIRDISAYHIPKKFD